MVTIFELLYWSAVQVLHKFHTVPVPVIRVNLDALLNHFLDFAVFQLWNISADWVFRVAEICFFRTQPCDKVIQSSSQQVDICPFINCTSYK